MKGKNINNDLGFKGRFMTNRFLTVWHGRKDRITRQVIEYPQDLLSHMVHRPGV